MEIVGILLVILAIWAEYCAVHSYNPVALLVAIISQPTSAQSILSQAQSEAASSSVTIKSSSDVAGATIVTAADIKGASNPTQLQKYAFNELATKYHVTDAANRQALIDLWNEESGWNPHAVNASSGAFGIPQILPSAHPDVSRNLSPQQQIDWGLQYIMQRYGSPLAAWRFERSHTPNWY